MDLDVERLDEMIESAHVLLAGLSKKLALGSLASARVTSRSLAFAPDGKRLIGASHRLLSQFEINYKFS
jgi:hypothetical protein